MRGQTRFRRSNGSTAQDINRSRAGKKDNCSIIVLDKFIQATRDSGYKGTASAISELVDNSIQAWATEISISMAPSTNDKGSIEVSVLDNGCGMDPFTLRQALRFGGSTRFGERSGLGRYGMGLPNASLSQARRVTVYTWQGMTSQARGNARTHRRTCRVFMSYLDVDQIVRGEIEEVPRPQLVKTAPALCQGLSGTLVLWTGCDRVDNRRVSTLTRKLEAELGRRFRHFLWRGLRIAINGRGVSPFDPLYLNPQGEISGAQLFGQELTYEVRSDSTNTETLGSVVVRFSELPVHEWYKLSNDEKRRMQVSRGAGVSIVRAAREVDYGWFFMGTKHRENYDDWWRCEIQFDPILDEAFGITHTKQQVRPQAHLIDALTPEIEAIARVLNSRARKAHMSAKAAEHFSQAERVASERDHLLPPLPKVTSGFSQALIENLLRRYPGLRSSLRENPEAARYCIIEDAVKDMTFFTYALAHKRLVLVVNPDHPFYREIYKPLAEGDSPRDQQLLSKIELLLLAAARSEAASARNDYGVLARHRLDWSNTLATFLND